MSAAPETVAAPTPAAEETKAPEVAPTTETPKVDETPVAAVCIHLLPSRFLFLLLNSTRL